MRLLAASALVLASCTPALAPLDVPAGCQPLLGTDCLLPYPSDFFLVDDAAQPSGKAVRVAPAAQPQTRAGAPFDVTAEQAIDGFSTVPTIVAMLDAELSPEGFVRLEDGGDLSLSKETSNTLLLEADTGATVPHFVDLDPRTKDTRRQAIIVHPFVGLKERTRYVVLLKGVRTKDGALAPAPEGFRRLRDGLAGSDPALAPLARAFDARLAPLAQQVGVSRAELQLAWEFTTGSSEWATRDLLRVRALTLSWLAENAPAVRVTDTREAPEDDTFRVVRGFVTGPRFCTNDAQPGCRLVRGDDGRVAQAGTVEFPFIAVIPKSAAMAPGPSPLFLFGHGFFGNLSEVDGGAARRIASETARTMVATEWWGMHFSDVGPVGDALTGRLAQTARFVERVHQGMANWLVLTKACEQLGALPAFQRPGGAPLVTGPADAFVGLSQGHILGGTMNALNPTTRKLVFNVGGAGLTHMMMRAEAFSGLFELLALAVSDPLEQRKFVAMIQRPIDRIDPATYARYLLREPLAGNAEKQVLMQIGLMDPSVPNLGSWLHARLLGLEVLSPSAATPWGLSARPYPAKSGLEVHDFQLGDVDAYYRASDFPKTKPIVHDSLRGQPSVLRQIDTFFRTGDIVQTCTGVCDPN